MTYENKNLPETTNQNEMMTITIPEATVDLISRLADENAMWIKITDGGFLFNDKVISEMKGRIISVNPYYVQWIDKKPYKIAYEGQAQPEGYELRCDIKIDVAGTIIGLSLPKTSTKTHLSQYLKFLKASGLRLEDVITRCRVKAVSSPHGRFNVVVFDAVGSINDLKAASASLDQDIIDVPVMEPSQPRPAQASTNPWA